MLHYLDNASTVFPKPDGVLQAAVALYASHGVNPARGAYDLATEAEAILTGCRKKVCALFGGPSPERVVFGYNATDALNLAIFGLLSGGGHVVSTRLEHNSVLRPIAHCVDDHGARATLVGFDARGFVDPDDVRRAITKDTRLVVVSHASNVLGTVQPIAAIGAICRAAGVPLLVDAAQSAGVIRIDMEEMGIDLVAFTGHKGLLGPMGVGGLVVGEGVEIPHTRAGGTGVDSARRRHLDEYPFRLEYGTPNMLGIAALSCGIDLIAEWGGVRAIHAREMELARVLWTALGQAPGVTLYCADALDAAARTPVFCFNVDGLPPGQVGARLDVDHDVACRTGLHCAPLVHESLGTSPAGAVRLSIGPTTTRADVDAAAAAVAELARELRG